MNELQLGVAIEGIRKMLGMPQIVLAKRIGLTVNYVCLLEKDKRGASQETLHRIAEVFGIPVCFFFIFAENVDAIKEPIMRECMNRIQGMVADELMKKAGKNGKETKI